MKKIFILTILLFTVLISCNKSDKLKIIVPAGAPALSQIYLQDSGKYDVDIVNGPDPLVAAFGSESHDFIFAPTNLGAKMYNNGIQYKFIAAVTFGNYYLASTIDDFKIEDLQNKEIICFGKNATSDIVLNYVLDGNSIQADIIYVDSLDIANSELVIDNDKIILSAEPALSVLKTKVEGISTIDLQAEYAELSGTGSYPQSGVFAKANLEDKIIDDFLNKLEASVEDVNQDAEGTASLAVELDYNFTYDVLVQAISQSNIDFEKAEEVKTSLEYYFNIIMEMNPALVGGKLPDEGFYYS